MVQQLAVPAVAALSTTLSTAALDKNLQSKERGITLDLGFSSFAMPLPDHLKHLPYDELQVTLVDCPGHASLIKTIIGGAQIINMMLLVVDVTRGIQTQVLCLHASCTLVVKLSGRRDTHCLLCKPSTIATAFLTNMKQLGLLAWQQLCLHHDTHVQTAECLVVGELATKHMVVVLNKVDQLPEEGRNKVISKAKKRLSQTLGSTKFAGCAMVPTAVKPGHSSVPLHDFTVLC